MTDKDKVKMFEMRLSGCTLQKIADKYGITRERVRQILLQSVTNRKVIRKDYEFDEGNLAKVVYPNISDWLMINGISIPEFARELSQEQGINYKATTRLENALQDKVEFTMKEIVAILKVTGMNFEYAFRKVEI